MTNGNDNIQTLYWKKREDGVPELVTENTGLTKREYFAANDTSITWQDAHRNCEAKKGETPTIAEVATYLAKMKVIYADALIEALNENQ